MFLPTSYLGRGKLLLEKSEKEENTFMGISRSVGTSRKTINSTSRESKVANLRGARPRGPKAEKKKGKWEKKDMGERLRSFFPVEGQLIRADGRL